MIEKAQMASQLSLTQIDALSKLVTRMAATLAWPQNHQNPAKTGFDQQDFENLSLLLKHPQYATTEKLEKILIPIQDHLLAQIDARHQSQSKSAKEIQRLVGNVRPIFEDVVIPGTHELYNAHKIDAQKAEQTGYVVSLIATIINPPKAQVLYPEFGRK